MDGIRLNNAGKVDSVERSSAVEKESRMQRWFMSRAKCFIMSYYIIYIYDWNDNNKIKNNNYKSFLHNIWEVLNNYFKINIIFVKKKKMY